MTEIGTSGKNEIEESKGDEEMKRGRGGKQRIQRNKEDYRETRDNTIPILETQ